MVDITDLKPKAAGPIISQAFMETAGFNLSCRIVHFRPWEGVSRKASWQEGALNGTREGNGGSALQRHEWRGVHGYQDAQMEAHQRRRGQCVWTVPRSEKPANWVTGISLTGGGLVTAAR
jgi:hypothetical protein